ncbi:MAG: hypothetical protein ACRCXC_02785 [Legionella sp.]
MQEAQRLETELIETNKTKQLTIDGLSTNLGVIKKELAKVKSELEDYKKLTQQIQPRMPLWYSPLFGLTALQVLNKQKPGFFNPIHQRTAHNHLLTPE